MTLFISDSIDNLETTSAYVGAVALCLSALIVLIVLTVTDRNREAWHGQAGGMSIHVESISKRFGDAVALDDVSLEVPSGLAHRAARPEWRRQVDAAAHHRRPRHARHAAPCGSRART